MGFSICQYLFRIGQRFSKGIPELPKSFGIKSWTSKIWSFSKHSKRIKGILFLGFAGVLGFWTDTVTEKEAVLKWAKSHPLPAELSQLVISHYGYELQKESKGYDEILYDFMTQVDDQFGFWASSDLNWIAHYPRGSDSASVVIYCQKGSKKVMNWQYLGPNWVGIYEFIDRAKLRKFSIPFPGFPISLEGLDSRAIFY